MQCNAYVPHPHAHDSQHCHVLAEPFVEHERCQCTCRSLGGACCSKHPDSSAVPTCCMDSTASHVKAQGMDVC
jgi:hypothetical protein